MWHKNIFEVQWKQMKRTKKHQIFDFSRSDFSRLCKSAVVGPPPSTSCRRSIALAPSGNLQPFVGMPHQLCQFINLSQSHSHSLGENNFSFLFLAHFRTRSGTNNYVRSPCRPPSIEWSNWLMISRKRYFSRTRCCCCYCWCSLSNYSIIHSLA